MDTVDHIEVQQMEQGKDDITFIENTKEEKRLLHKIDLWMLPAIWILYLVSYMDRSNIGNAKVAGMMIDLGLTDSQYSLAITMFLVPYIVCEIPSNMILTRCRPSLYIAAIMVLWGTMAALMAAVQTPTQLIVLRFLLGVFEAGFGPAVLFLISSWYRQAELAKRYLLYISAATMSGAFGSIIAGIITSRVNGAYGIAGWRWLFIVEGVLTIGIGFISSFLLLDYPATSRKLTPVERELASKRLTADNITFASEGEELNHRRTLRLSLTSWRVWLIAAGYSVIGSGFSMAYFYPTLVAGLGYSAINAQFMTAPLYGAALVAMIPVCVLADRFPRYRPVFTFVCLAIAGIFSIVSALVHAYVPRYVFLCIITCGVYIAAPLALSFAADTLGSADTETRAVALALINAAGSVGQFYGTSIFPSTESPIYLKGFVTLAALLPVGAFFFLAGFFLFKRFPIKGRI